MQAVQVSNPIGLSISSVPRDCCSSTSQQASCSAISCARTACTIVPMHDLWTATSRSAVTGCGDDRLAGSTLGPLPEVLLCRLSCRRRGSRRHAICCCLWRCSRAGRLVADAEAFELGGGAGGNVSHRFAEVRQRGLELFFKYFLHYVAIIYGEWVLGRREVVPRCASRLTIGGAMQRHAGREAICGRKWSASICHSK